MKQKPLFEDCTKCPFCVISKDTAKMAKVFCTYFDKVVSKVLISKVLNGTAIAKLPKNCPYIDGKDKV